MPITLGTSTVFSAVEAASVVGSSVGTSVTGTAGLCGTAAFQIRSPKSIITSAIRAPASTTDEKIIAAFIKPRFI